MDKRLEYKLKSTSMLIVKLLTKIDFVGFELHYLLLFTSYRSSVSVCLSMCLSGIYIFDDSSLNLDAIGQLCPRDKYRHGPRMGTKIGRDLGCNTWFCQDLSGTGFSLATQRSVCEPVAPTRLRVSTACGVSVRQRSGESSPRPLRTSWWL